MLNASSLYPILGGILLLVALLIATDKAHPSRWSSALFWALYGSIFVVGDYLPAAVVGAAALVMAGIAGCGFLSRKPEEQPLVASRSIGHWLFAPAVALPALTLLGMLAMTYWPALHDWVDPNAVTLISLGVACLLALVWTLKLTGDTPVQATRETQRLLEAMGFAVILPQLLAVLGLMFNQTGVGQLLASMTSDVSFVQHKAAVVVLYCASMALFTVVMGNAFAAFPVITAGIGIPLLMVQHHGNPAVIAAIGMFCGYCGTLMTPMAANFNLVPALLLELRDQHAVIKAQFPTALLLLVVNIGLMYWLAF